MLSLTLLWSSEKGWKACPALGRNHIYAMQLYLVQIYTIPRFIFPGTLNILQTQIVYQTFYLVSYKVILKHMLLYCRLKVFTQNSLFYHKLCSGWSWYTSSDTASKSTSISLKNSITCNAVSQVANASRITTSMGMLSLMWITYQYIIGKTFIKKKCICGMWNAFYLEKKNTS